MGNVHLKTNAILRMEKMNFSVKNLLINILKLEFVKDIFKIPSVLMVTGANTCIKMFCLQIINNIYCNCISKKIFRFKEY